MFSHSCSYKIVHVCVLLNFGLGTHVWESFQHVKLWLWVYPSRGVLHLLLQVYKCYLNSFHRLGNWNYTTKMVQIYTPKLYDSRLVISNSQVLHLLRLMTKKSFFIFLYWYRYFFSRLPFTEVCSWGKEFGKHSMQGMELPTLFSATLMNYYSI